jgi:2,3-bisphosphoglycerate-dependent phosphoglycerate mutase
VTLPDWDKEAEADSERMQHSVHSQTSKERLLILVRHGQSEGNERNVFTGWNDLPLTHKGEVEARAVGTLLRDRNLQVDVAFSSSLERAWRTCEIALATMNLSEIGIIRNKALNERNYGTLTGCDKDVVRQYWGERLVQVWRRSYDTPPPNGESLRDTVARVLPYFLLEILPRILNGQRTLVVAHGNSLRALVMVLDRCSRKTIGSVEIDTGEVRCYWLAANSEVERRAIYPIEKGSGAYSPRLSP